MVVAFDTETHGFDWFDGQTAFLASWADADGEYVADLSDPEQTQRFVNALDSADTLVCHNLSFDVHQVKATLGYDFAGKTLHDTDLMARVAYPEGNSGTGFGFKLKELGKMLLRDDAQDAQDTIKELGESIGASMNSPGAYYDIWRAYP